MPFCRTTSIASCVFSFFIAKLPKNIKRGITDRTFNNISRMYSAFYLTFKTFVSNSYTFGCELFNIPFQIFFHFLFYYCSRMNLIVAS